MTGGRAQKKSKSHHHHNQQQLLKKKRKERLVARAEDVSSVPKTGISTKKKKKKKKKKLKSKLEDLYSNIRLPGSYSGIETTRHYSGRSRRDVIDFLSGQEGYTLHKPTTTRFRRRRVYSKGIADLLQADLVDLSSIATYNEGHRFLLTAIDVFSKRAWAIPLKSKSGRDVTSAFDRILKDLRFNMVQTDKGTEFKNIHFQRLMTEYNVHHYTSENDDLKASVVERFNRTLKQKMFRYFSTHQTRRYLDVLDDLIDSYNNTRHRSIGMAPSQVSAENEQKVRDRLYGSTGSGKRQKFSFRVGDTVRIVMKRMAFRKGYEEGRWSRELFVVSRQISTKPVTYELVDLDGDPIKGAFYGAELQKVRKPDEDTLYAVEKILKTRRRKDGSVEHFVKWVGFPSKFNSWTADLVTRGNV